MNNIHRFDFPLCLPIFKKHMENPKTVVLSFLIPEEKRVVAKPGQYFMLWLPGNDEIPIAVNNYRHNIISFTISGVGPTSNEIIKKEKDYLIGLRGPYGNGFDFNLEKDVIIIAGGIGMAPLRFLIHKLISKTSTSRKIVLINGAKTKSDLLFKNEMEQLSIETEFCTEDGSYGYCGFVSDKLEDILEDPLNKSSNWEIFSCGPELMLKNVLTIAQNHNLEKNTQICLSDRFIRCGFGICGSCFMDDLGLSICRDGPVFRGDVLMKVNDFGKFGRGADGSKFPFNR